MPRFGELGRAGALGCREGVRGALRAGELVRGAERVAADAGRGVTGGGELGWVMLGDAPGLAVPLGGPGGVLVGGVALTVAGKGICGRLGGGFSPLDVAAPAPGRGGTETGRGGMLTGRGGMLPAGRGGCLFPGPGLEAGGADGGRPGLLLGVEGFARSSFVIVIPSAITHCVMLAG